MESVLERLHPEIEWVEPEIEGLLHGGTHHGMEAVTNVDRRRQHGGCGGRVQRSLQGRRRANLALRPRVGDPRRQGIRVEPFVDTLVATRALGNAG
jgi:hypothetical protein